MPKYKALLGSIFSIRKKDKSHLGVGVHICNLSTRETTAGGSSGIQSQ